MPYRGGLGGQQVDGGAGVLLRPRGRDVVLVDVSGVVLVEVQDGVWLGVVVLVEVLVEVLAKVWLGGVWLGVDVDAGGVQAGFPDEKLIIKQSL